MAKQGKSNMSIKTYDIEYNHQSHPSLVAAIEYANANEDILTVSFETEEDRVRLEKTTSGHWEVDVVEPL